MTHNKKDDIISQPLNLSKTQRGYVPLEDRFKSFPKDSENMPITDFRFFYDAFANGRLEKATYDLLYPIPRWLKRKLGKKGLVGAYLKSGDGKLFIANNKYMVTTGKA